MDSIGLVIANGVHNKAQWTNITTSGKSIVDYILFSHQIDKDYGLRSSIHRNVSCEHLLITAKLDLQVQSDQQCSCPLVHSQLHSDRDKAVKIKYNSDQMTINKDTLNKHLLKLLTTPLLLSPETLLGAVKTFLDNHCAPKQIDQSNTVKATKTDKKFQFDINVHGNDWFFIKSILQELKSLRFNNVSKYFVYIRHLTGLQRNRKVVTVNMDEIIDEDDQVSNQVFQVWTRRFTSMFNIGSASTFSLTIDLTPQQLVTQISNSPNGVINTPEVFEAIRKLKLKKAPGLDNVPVEVIKNLCKNAQSPLPRCLAHVYNLVFHNSHIPVHWFKSIVIVIHKAKDERDPTNWRPITLIPTFRKLFTTIINRRLIQFVESKSLLTDHQFGFRSGRSISDVLFIFNCILNRFVISAGHNSEIVVFYIDLREAYDSLQFGMMNCKIQQLDSLA